VDHVVYGTVLEAGAYTRMPLATGIGTLSSDASLGPRSLDVTTRVQNDLASGHPQTQYRLRFPIETDGDATSDFCDFYGASTADVSLRPVLVVTYQH